MQLALCVHMLRVFLGQSEPGVIKEDYGQAATGKKRNYYRVGASATVHSLHKNEVARCIMALHEHTPCLQF